MYRPYATPLHLELGSSRYLAGWLIVVHVTALLVLLLLNLPAGLLALLVLVVMFNLVASWRRVARRSHPRAITAVIWKNDGELVLTRRNGQQVRTRLAKQAFILPWLVILHFKTTGLAGRTLLIAPDMLPANTFRRLRVRLRITMEEATT